MGIQLYEIYTNQLLVIFSYVNLKIVFFSSLLRNNKHTFWGVLFLAPQSSPWVSKTGRHGLMTWMMQGGSPMTPWKLPLKKGKNMIDHVAKQKSVLWIWHFLLGMFDSVLGSTI